MTLKQRRRVPFIQRKIRSLLRIVGNFSSAKIPLCSMVEREEGGARQWRVEPGSAVARIKLSFEAQNAFSISIRGSR